MATRPVISIRDHVLLSLILVASRAAFLWAGIRFDFSLELDVVERSDDLRDRLLETGSHK